MNIKEFSDNFGDQDHQIFVNFWLIYFLVDRSGEIVYVGKSSNSGLGKRLLSHGKSKDFASYFIQSGPKDEKEAYKLEGAFISLLRPKYNKANLLSKPEEFKGLANWMESDKVAKAPKLVRVSLDAMLAVNRVYQLILIMMSAFTFMGFLFLSGGNTFFSLILIISFISIFYLKRKIKHAHVTA